MIFSQANNSKLGILGTKAPEVSKSDLPLFVQQQKNNCNFLLRVADNSQVMDDTGDAARIASNNFKNTSNQTDWMPLSDHPQNSSAQRTMTGLVIGSLTNPNYNTGDLRSASYRSTDATNSSHDAGLSPDAGASNRPTPNSNASSDTRSNQHPGQGNQSSLTSYETSPSTSNQNISNTPSDSRSMSGFFSGNPDYSNIGPTGLTPDTSYNMAETPDLPQGWESSQTTGLTPVGEGVFRHLMALSSVEPLEAMDLNWEGGS